MSLTILFGTIYGFYYTILISFYLYLRLAITNYHACKVVQAQYRWCLCDGHWLGWWGRFVPNKVGFLFFFLGGWVVGWCFQGYRTSFLLAGWNLSLTRWSHFSKEARNPLSSCRTRCYGDCVGNNGSIVKWLQEFSPL